MIEGILNFIKDLKIRNESLFYFGLFCLSLSIIFIVLTKLTTTQVQGVVICQVGSCEVVGFGYIIHHFFPLFILFGLDIAKID